MKKNILKTMLSALVLTAFASHAGDVLPGGNGTQTVSMPVNSATCTVSLPTNYELSSMDSTKYNSLSQWGIIETANIGSIDFSNCAGAQVNIAVGTSNTVANSGYTYPKLNGRSQDLVGYWLTLNSSAVKPNGAAVQYTVVGATDSVALNLTATKMKNMDWPSNDAGQFSATYTYTVTYS
ncbi:hypothetical protein MZE45_23710 [Escherichia coli]|nr:hypothetical protein [Escherichia coli]